MPPVGFVKAVFKDYEARILEDVFIMISRPDDFSYLFIHFSTDGEGRY